STDSCANSVAHRLAAIDIWHGSCCPERRACSGVDCECTICDSRKLGEALWFLEANQTRLGASKVPAPHAALSCSAIRIYSSLLTVMNIEHDPQLVPSEHVAYS